MCAPLSGDDDTRCGPSFVDPTLLVLGPNEKHGNFERKSAKRKPTSRFIQIALTRRRDRASKYNKRRSRRIYISWHTHAISMTFFVPHSPDGDEKISCENATTGRDSVPSPLPAVLIPGRRAPRSTRRDARDLYRVSVIIVRYICGTVTAPPTGHAGRGAVCRRDTCLIDLLQHGLSPNHKYQCTSKSPPAT